MTTSHDLDDYNVIAHRVILHEFKLRIHVDFNFSFGANFSLLKLMVKGYNKGCKTKHRRYGSAKITFKFKKEEKFVCNVVDIFSRRDLIESVTLG